MDKINRFGILLALLVFFILVTCFNGYSTDDAFISYRFAENMASGHGLVYNIDQAPVEGYTNFLWTIILSAIALVKLPLPETAAFLSTFFSIGLLILMSIWASRQKEFTPRFSIAMPAIVLASCPALALWATTGMETTFFAFLLVLGTVFLGMEERRELIGILSGLTFALAALTRPEGLLLGGIIILFSFIEGKDWGMRFVSFIIRSVIFILPPVLHILWRKSYYGQWFPNTFYAKTASGDQLVGLGLEYFKGFMFQIGVVLFVLTILALFVRPKIEGIWTILILSITYSAYVVWIGGDWMPANRMFIPILPFLVMGASTFIIKAVDAGPRFASFLVLGVCVFLLFQGFNAQIPFMRHSLLSQKLLNDDPPVDVLIELGLHLRGISSPYDLIAVVPAGKVPYYSGLRTIDMRGLCDAHISKQPILKDLNRKLPGHLRRDPEYVLSKKPDFIVLSGATPKDSIRAIELDHRAKTPILDEWSILKMPEFVANYREVRVPMAHGDKDLLFYKRLKDGTTRESELKFPNGFSESEIVDRVVIEP